MTLLARLAAMVEALPDGASVALPVGWLRAELEAEGAESSSAPLADLTVEALAAELGRSPSTVRGWLIEGSVPGAYKLRGREWRIPRAAVRAFLVDQASGEGRGTVKRPVPPRPTGAPRKRIQGADRNGRDPLLSRWEREVKP